MSSKREERTLTFESRRARLHVLGDGAIELRPSTIPGAGLGLFALVHFAPSDPITSYYGQLINHAESVKRRDAKKASHIRAHIYQQWAIDGLFAPDGTPITDPLTQLQEHGGGSMVNSKRREDRPNAEFELLRSPQYDEALDDFVLRNSPDRRQPEDALTIITAVRDIKPGDEIFVDYGPFYDWKSGGGAAEPKVDDSSDGSDSWLLDEEEPPPPLELIPKKRRT